MARRGTPAGWWVSASASRVTEDKYTLYLPVYSNITNFLMANLYFENEHDRGKNKWDLFSSSKFETEQKGIQVV